MTMTMTMPTNSRGKDSSGVIEVAIPKYTRTDRVGLILCPADEAEEEDEEEEEYGGAILVHGIAKTSLFAGTQLKVGMQVLSICGIPTTNGMTFGQAMRLMREAEDVVVIEAKPYTKKPRRISTTTAAHHHNPPPRVIVYEQQQQLQPQPEHPRHKGVSMGDLQITPSPPTTTRPDPAGRSHGNNRLRKDTTRQQKPPMYHHKKITDSCPSISDDPPGLVSVTAHKSNPKEQIGIGLRAAAAGPEEGTGAGVVIDTIQPNSIFRNHRELRPGMIVLKINGQDFCPSSGGSGSPFASVKQATRLLKQLGRGGRGGGNTTTTITIVATTVQQQQKELREQQTINNDNNNNERSQVRFAPGTKEGSHMNMAAPSVANQHSILSNDFSKYEYSLDAPSGLGGGNNNNNNNNNNKATTVRMMSQDNNRDGMSPAAGRPTPKVTQFQSTISDITIDSYLIHPYATGRSNEEEEKKMEDWYAINESCPRKGISMGDLQVSTRPRKGISNWGDKERPTNAIRERMVQGDAAQSFHTTIVENSVVGSTESYETPFLFSSMRQGGTLSPIPQGDSTSGGDSKSNSSPSSQDLQSSGGGISQDDILTALAAEDSLMLQRRGGTAAGKKIQMPTSVRKRRTSMDPPTKRTNTNTTQEEAINDEPAVFVGLQERLPPPGLAPGGHWGCGHRGGSKHSTLFTLLGCASSLLGHIKKAKEELELYQLDGHCYDIQGCYVGSEASTKFQYNPSVKAGKSLGGGRRRPQTQQVATEEYSVGYSI